MQNPDVVEDSEPEREQRRKRARITDDAPDGEPTWKTTHLTSSRTPAPPLNRPAPPVRKDAPDNLSGSQLARLSRCVGCGLEWTSRKTAKQKRTHITQCAKKHALTKDTIRVLVGKEITAPSPTQNTDLNRVTLMDSVVPIGPVKKSKRQQVLPTVKSLPETRDSILNRARGILGPTNGQAEPHLTQQFGRSSLASRHSRLLSLLGPMEEPTSTQPFGASSLRSESITAEKSSDDCEVSSSLQFGTSLFAQGSVSSNNDHQTTTVGL